MSFNLKKWTGGQLWTDYMDDQNDNIDKLNNEHPNLAQKATVDAMGVDLGIIQEDFGTAQDEILDLQGRMTTVERVVGKSVIVDSWEAVQDIVRSGEAKHYFKVGDKFLTTYEGNPFELDVIGIDHDAPNSLTLQFTKCLLNAQFSAPQALYHAKTALPAGEQVFTQDGDNIKYKFTTSSIVPVGGVIYVYSWSDYVPALATTYAADRKTAIDSALPVTTASGGASNTLATINVRARCRYGSNNYRDSAIRQWLNSDASSFVWESKTDYDLPSTAAPYTGSGFLKRLDPELVAVIGAVTKTTKNNTVTDDGGGANPYYSLNDKIFLLSRLEVDLGDGDAATGEKKYAFYDGIGDSGRIKLLAAAASSWWLRSPYSTDAYIVRFVTTAGASSGSTASYALGVAPACVII